MKESESRWTQFKDRIPKSEDIFVTDFCSVWVSRPPEIQSWRVFAENNPDYAWSDIEIPITPEKPIIPHQCRDSFSSAACFSVNGELWVKEFQDGVKPEGRTYRVKFCPFCGVKSIK